MAHANLRPVSHQQVKQQLHELRPSSRDSVGDFIQYWADRRSRFVGQIERQAFLQVAWVLGYQDYEYDMTNGTLVDTSSSDNSPWWAVNARENRLLPMVEGRIVKFMSRAPIWKVLPATADEEDEMVAGLGTRVLQHYWRNVLNMDRKVWEAHWWAEVTGTAFIVSGWDPESGPVVDVEEEDFSARFGFDDPTLFKRIFGDKSQKKESFPLGDAVCDVNTIFDTFVSPSARTIEEADFVLFRRLRTMDYLESRYGKKKTANLNPGTGMTDVPFFSQLHRLASSGVYDQSLLQDDLILTHELWVKPERKSRPGGIHAVYAQGEELQRQDIPYDHKQIPVSVIQGQPYPFSIYGGCKVGQLMETQQRLNDIRSNKHEHMHTTVYPKIIAPSTAGIDDEAFTTSFGEIIFYLGAKAPEYMTLPPLPSYMDALERDSLQAFQDLSDIHEVTSAQAPASVRTGRAVLALQAQDDARFIMPIQFRNIALARTGRHVLSMLHQYVTEDRLIQIASDDWANEVMVFKDVQGFIGGDLVGKRIGTPGVDYFRVICDVDSQMPLSPEGQRTIIEGLLENQVLNPQKDREMILRLFGLGSADPLLEAGQVHRSMAMKENRFMASGRRADPKKWHNHAAHIQIHLRWLNSSEFESLPQESKDLAESHLAKHYFLASSEALRPQLLASAAQEFAPQMIKQELQQIIGQGDPGPGDGSSGGESAEEIGQA